MSTAVNQDILQSVKKLQSIGRFNTMKGVLRDEFDAPSTGVFDNINLPAQFLTQITPYMATQLFQPTTAEMLVGSKVKLLDWEKQLAQIPYVSYAGDTQAYDDFSPPTTASVRYDWETVGHYRFTVGFALGRLESLQFGTTGLDLYTKKVEACLLILKQFMNNLFFYGYQAGTAPSTNDIQGILTSRYLNNHETLQKKIGGAGYTYQDGYQFFVDILNKFIDLTAGQNLVGSTTINVGLSPDAYKVFNRLTVINNNFSVTSLLKQVQIDLPIKIILCPELTKAHNGKDLIVAIADRLPNATAETAILGFSEDALFSELVQVMDATYGKISAGICGFIPLHPAGIIRYTDVLAS